MKRLLFLILFSILVPIIMISLFFKCNIEKIITGFNSNKKDEKNIFVRVLKSDNTVENIDLEKYIIGVVSSEMPVTFETEALKAQAVASRTYALKQMENNKDKEYDVTDNTLSQVYSTNEELKNRWGDNYQENYNKIEKIVKDTKGEYISYNDDFIYAFFFSTSNGYTEDNVNVFGADLPYLKPVNSEFDKEENTNFEYTIDIDKSEFYNKIGLNYSDRLIITNERKSNSNRVLYLEINGVSFKGRELQKLLGLRSNDYTIQENDDNMVITTKGFGHGVGMSQYGSNALAKQNKTYTDILKYYYQGTEIKKL